MEIKRWERDEFEILKVKVNHYEHFSGHEPTAKARWLASAG